MQMAGPTREFDSAGLGRASEFCISNKIPGDADAAGLGPYFEDHWSSSHGFSILAAHWNHPQRFLQSSVS